MNEWMKRWNQAELRETLTPSSSIYVALGGGKNHHRISNATLP